LTDIAGNTGTVGYDLCYTGGLGGCSGVPSLN